MTKYNIIRDGEIVARNLSLRLAALTLINNDGYRHFFKRLRNGDLELWISRRSANVGGGMGGFVRSAFVGNTQSEALKWIIGQEWRGYEAEAA